MNKKESRSNPANSNAIPAKQNFLRSIKNVFAFAFQTKVKGSFAKKRGFAGLSIYQQGVRRIRNALRANGYAVPKPAKLGKANATSWRPSGGKEDEQIIPEVYSCGPKGDRRPFL